MPWSALGLGFGFSIDLIHAALAWIRAKLNPNPKAPKP